MRTKQKLIDVFDDALGNGIFKTLQGFNVPWKNEDIATQLDLAFFSNYGARQISPLVKTCLDENGKLTSAKQCLLASSIFNIHKVDWEKQYQTMLFEYNPIENYRMIETHTGSDTKTDTPDDWKETTTQTPTNWKSTETQTPTDWKETETRTPTDWKDTETKTPTNWKETETQTPTDWIETTEGLKADNTAHTANSIYAFNSTTDPAPVSESDAETDSKTTVERTGTFETEKETSGTFQTEVSHTGTFETETKRTGTFETETEQTGTFETKTEHTGTFESKTEYDTELQRSGNIGVTTSQQMIESERQLWTWNFFQNVVFKDITKMLALSIY